MRPETRRPLPVQVTAALAVIADSGTRNVPLNDFRLRMDQRGWSPTAADFAIRSLERRGWASVVGSILRVREAGFAAATDGVVVHCGKARERPQRKLKRMPAGLF